MQEQTALSLKSSKGETIEVKSLKRTVSPPLETSWSPAFQKPLQRKVVSAVYSKDIINH